MIRWKMKANRFYWIFYWIICSLLSDPIIFAEWVRKQKNDNPWAIILGIVWSIRDSNSSPLDCQSNALAR